MIIHLKIDYLSNRESISLQNKIFIFNFNNQIT